MRIILAAIAPKLIEAWKEFFFAEEKVSLIEGALRKLNVVGMTGFEPATPSSRTKYVTGLRYIPKSGLISFS
jgi:hypothetical protein